ncbi:MAG: flavohemoglobin expression-modulating QEGLA motif protein [Actinomycetota bacterium]|nr:flavohemoglobin expression-modulating QEGLA motif protein [Actinomycetota bacterium]
MRWTADAELAAIAQELDLLLNLTPVNSASAWQEFEASRFLAAPRFVYRDLQFDIDEMRRRLANVGTDDVDEPLVAGLLESKRREIALELDLLEKRNTPRFLEISMSLFGRVTPALLERALGLLSALPSTSADGDRVSPEEMRRRAIEELSYYHSIVDSFTCEVEIRDDVVDLMVHRGNVLIGASVAVRRDRVVPLLQHEIGTHVVTYFNATEQPLTLLRIGLDGYEETQEGIAVLAEYAVDGLDAERMRLLAGRVVAIHRMIEGWSFVEIFDELKVQHDFSAHTAWSVTARVARSGGLTKDVIYLRGLINVIEHLKGGASLDPLLAGKMALVHVPAIEQLIERGVLRPPLVHPRWVHEGAARLEAIGPETTMLDLVTTR